MLITDYPDIVRREGLAVEVVSGFASRSHGEFQRTPPYIVWHHDASPVGPSPGVLDWMLSNWDEASANAWVDYNGKWWFVGAGVAWHAGVVLPGMPNNFTAMGIETDYTVGEEISWNLYDSLRRGTAAIMRANGQPASDLHFHKTICSPPGRKSDPWGLDLGTERAAVAALIRGGNSPLPLPDQGAPQGPGGADPKTPQQIEEEELMAAKDDIIKEIRAIPGRVVNGSEFATKVNGLVINVFRGAEFANIVKGIVGSEVLRLLRSDEFKQTVDLAADGKRDNYPPATPPKA